MAHEFPKWPAMYYGPDGEADVFESASDVPKGWKDKPTDAYYKRLSGSPAVAAVAAEDAREIGELKARIVALEEENATLKATIEQGPQKGPTSDAGLAADIDGNGDDETLTRKEALALLRSRGVKISSKASDEEIEKALSDLEA